MKKLIVILFIIFGSFLTFSLYRTFAYDTSVVEEVPSTTDLEYTFKIGNSSIKQITVDSGETKYYDIVLSNPNNAKISYSVYYEMVSPTGIVGNNGNITLNIVVTNTSSNAVTVKLGTVVGYVKGGELTLGSGQVVIPKQSASKYIMSLEDGTSGDSGSGVYKVTHSAIPAESSATGSEIPAVTDYRYYGSSPNNYICLDMEGQSTCPDKHLYRIIGSIYEENAGQNLLKVIKATPLTDGTTNEFSWNIKSDGTYNSVWSTTTSGTSSGSTLMQLLNGIWLTRENGIYYQQNDKTIKVNFTNYGPSDYAQSLINTTSRYYLGGYDFYELKTSKTYLAERGTATSSGNANYWDGKIALTYVSDYGYAAGNTCVTEKYPVYYDYNSKCDDKDWLQINKQHWTITPSSDIAIYNGGSSDYPAYASYLQCNPTFYLSKDVIITGGTGTQTDPYIASK